MTIKKLWEKTLAAAKGLNVSSTMRWLAVGIITFMAMTYALTDIDQVGYVKSWGGALFKVMSGGCLGFMFSRFIMKLDVSAMPAEQRSLAALSQAVIVAAGMIGTAYGI